MTSLLEKRLYRIVEGQVRSFRNDHPEKFSAAALSKREWRTVEYSLAKRIVPLARWRDRLPRQFPPNSHSTCFL